MSTIIHIGLAKTGTSWLQKKVFPKLDVEYHHCGKYEMCYVEKDKPLLLSFEGFSGSAYGNDRYHLLDKLKDFYPDAKIILVLREKDTYLKSLYKQHIRGGGIDDLSMFLLWIKDQEGFLDWGKYTTEIEKRFDLLICFFEFLKSNPKEFVESICEFIGCDVPKGIDYSPVNTGMSDVTTERWRTMNKFFKSRWNKNGPLPRECNPLLYLKYLESL